MGNIQLATRVNDIQHYMTPCSEIHTTGVGEYGGGRGRKRGEAGGACRGRRAGEDGHAHSEPEHSIFATDIAVEFI